MFFTSFPPVLKATSKQLLLEIFITCQENRREPTWLRIPGENVGFKAPLMEMLPPSYLVEWAIMLICLLVLKTSLSKSHWH